MLSFPNPMTDIQTVVKERAVVGPLLGGSLAKEKDGSQDKGEFTIIKGFPITSVSFLSAKGKPLVSITPSWEQVIV